MSIQARLASAEDDGTPPDPWAVVLEWAESGTLAEGANEEEEEGADEDGDEEEYAVKRILRVKGTGSGRKYYIEWVGWPENTWEPLKHLKNAMELVDAFDAAHASKKQRREESDESDGEDSDASSVRA